MKLIKKGGKDNANRICLYETIGISSILIMKERTKYAQVFFFFVVFFYQISYVKFTEFYGLPHH